MSNRRIIYTRSDGGINVVIPCRNIKEEHLTDDDIFQRAWDKLPKEAINPQSILQEQIPSDRTFRNAWKQTQQIVEVDMGKARIIHMGKIREARNEKLANLDIETMKAVTLLSTEGENGAAVLNKIEVLKQALRDIPQTFNLNVAKNPEELKALWPKELK